MIKRLIVLVALLLLIPIVYAIPPDAPVLVYGKVIYENGLPAGGIAVRATWIDQNNHTKTFVTRSFDIEEVSDSNKSELFGVYMFEITNSIPGTKIMIEAGKKSVLIESDPGKQLKAKDIVLELPKGNNSIYNIPYNKTALLSILNFIKKLLFSEDMGLQQDSISGEYQSNDKNDTDVVPGSVGSNNKTILPSDDTGQSNDSSDQDYGNDFNPVQDKGTTLSKSNTTLASIKKNMSQNTLIGFYSTKNIQKNIIPILLIVIILLIIFFIIGAIIIWIRYYKNIKEKFNVTKITIDDISSIKSKNVMKENINVLERNSSILEAIEIFSAKNVNVLPVLQSGNIIGSLTKMDILKNLEKNQFDYLEKTRIEKIMNKKPIVCKKESGLGDIFTLMLEKKVCEIIIEDKGRYKGTIDYFDFLNLFKKMSFTIENPPNVSEAMIKEAQTIESHKTIKDLKDLFISQDIEYAIVTKNTLPVGIVTSKDLIISIGKNLDSKSPIETIMSINMVTLTPGTSIYDAFKIMTERRFNQIPLKMFDKITGILQISYLVKLYFELIQELDEKVKKDPFNTVKITEEK